MGITRWVQAAAAAALLVTVGCNLYNPTGTGDASRNPFENGEEQYRHRQFAAAMISFSAAIAADSNNSLAYYWYAKSAARYYQLESSVLLNDLEEMDGGANFAFTDGYSDSAITLRMQAASRVNRILYLLTDRDTLSRWYNYLRDSTSRTARADTLRDRRIAFIQRYLDSADAGRPGYRPRSRFPLSDFKMPYDRVIIDLTTYKTLYVFSTLRDLDKNDTIDSRDDLLNQISYGKGEGGFAIDSLSKIAGTLETDPQATQNLNEMIQGMQTGLVDVSALAGLINFSGGGDDNGAGNEASTNIDSVINSLGGSIVFFQFGDTLDNDADGCIDEEVLDDKDNDGDGYVDEDARITVHTLFERADNDRNGRMNDSGWVNDSTAYVPLEDKIGPNHVTFEQPNPNILAFVHNFYTRYPDSTGNFIKIHKGDATIDIRTRMQRDSLALPSRRLLPNYAQKLDSAKALIGGCWRNYTTPGLGKRARR